MHPPVFAHSICCIGAGYVGGPTCAVIADQCPNILVTIVDINVARIAQWNTATLPIYEPGLSEIIFKCRGKNLFFTADIDDAIDKSDIIFIAVNTPTKISGIGIGMAADTSFLESAIRRIALVSRTSKIIVEKSTVPCKTAAAIHHILEVNKKEDVNFSILSNPEFLAEGTAIADLLHPDRILIGSFQNNTRSSSEQILASIYERWVPREKIVHMSIWSSELTKLAANAMLAQRISSINALSAICEATGANIGEVAHAIGLDSRVGSKFLNASVGFGGSCFKKDILSLIYLCESYNLTQVAEYWQQVITLNEYQKSRFIKRIIDRQFGCVSRKHIAIYGFAFKKDTGDTRYCIKVIHRESPAITIAADLIRENAHLAIYDPKVSSQQIFHDLESQGLVEEAKIHVTVHSCPYAAASNCDAIVVCTEWEEFLSLNYSAIYASMKKPAFIFDGRNLLNARHLGCIGFEVEQIGLPSTANTSCINEQFKINNSLSVLGKPRKTAMIPTVSDASNEENCYLPIR